MPIRNNGINGKALLKIWPSKGINPKHPNSHPCALQTKLFEQSDIKTTPSRYFRPNEVI